MDINDLTIGQAKELAAMFSSGSATQAQPVKNHPFIGQKVIVRTYASGVHLATLSEYDYQSRTAILTDSKRIWSWSGAFTLSALANSGVKSAKVSESLETFFVAQVEEIIPVKSIAVDSINAQGIHNG